MRISKILERVLSDESIFPMDSKHTGQRAKFLKDKETKEDKEDIISEYLRRLNGKG